jgi:hypothetical protein
MLLDDVIKKVNLAIDKLPFGDTEIVTVVTNANNPSEMCVYVDNGIYCIKLSFFDVDFDGEELLSHINFDRLKLTFEDYEFSNHTKWSTPYWMIVELSGNYPDNYSGNLPPHIKK